MEMRQVCIVEDNIIGMGETFLGGKLGGEDSIDLLVIQLVSLFNALATNIFGCVDDQDTVNQIGLLGLDQKGNGEDAIGVIQTAGLPQHLRSNERMENGLQLSAFLRLGKHDASQFGTIQFASTCQNLLTETFANLLQSRLALLYHLARDYIAVNDRDAEFRKELAGSRFATADATGETNNQHGESVARIGLLVQVSSCR